MFHPVQTWCAIRAMCTDSSLKEGHVYNHESNYLAVDYRLIVYGNRELKHATFLNHGRQPEVCSFPI